jgi:hypothetical protein
MTSAGSARRRARLRKLLGAGDQLRDEGRSPLRRAIRARGGAGLRLLDKYDESAAWRF